MRSGDNSFFNFRELKAWQKAIIFSESVIRLVDQMEAPRRHYRLIEQPESASASVAMNIAGGKGRQTTREFIQFLYIARGSLFQVITLVILFAKLDWIKNTHLEIIRQDALEVTKTLNSLIKSMRKRLISSYAH